MALSSGIAVLVISINVITNMRMLDSLKSKQNFNLVLRKYIINNSIVRSQSILEKYLILSGSRFFIFGLQPLC